MSRRSRRRPPKSIGIVFYVKNRPAFDLTDKIADWLEQHGVGVWFEAECGAALGGGRRVSPMVDLVRKVDLVLAIGGDGTLLNAARFAAPAEKPLLGVNRGTVGFLTELTPSGVIQGLERLLNGDFTVEPRMMLDVSVIRKDRVRERHIGLNDAVVKREVSRLLRYNLALDGNYLDSFPADGVIVATPTGSTAYSLSAGGPVVKPDVNVLLICPICPHRVYGRSLIVNATDRLEISFHTHVAEGIEEPSDTEGITLTVDGQTRIVLDAADRVRVQQARHRTHLVRFAGSDFFHVLRSKLA